MLSISSIVVDTSIFVGSTEYQYVPLRDWVKMRQVDPMVRQGLRHVRSYFFKSMSEGRPEMSPIHYVGALLRNNFRGVLATTFQFALKA